MIQQVFTSPLLIKTLPLGVVDNNPLKEALDAFAFDKGYTAQAVRSLAQRGSFSSMVSGLLHRGFYPYSGSTDTTQENIQRLRGVIDFFGERVNPGVRGKRLRNYLGRAVENTQIDRVLSLSSNQQNFVGEGAASQLLIPDIRFDSRLIDTPICIVGAGAAGIMIAHALQQIGFRKITVFEKQRSVAGIWAHSNVHEGSRNNPRNIVFNEHFHLRAAPGGGNEVRSFLTDILQSHNTFVSTREVLEIRPGDLEHEVIFKDGTSNSYPIVINAIGLGKPKPLTDKDRMIGPKESRGALRWQKVGLTHEKVHGKRFVFIGLGNSTAEMLRQIHTLQDAGADVDYRVLTHYPADAIHNPSDVVEKNERMFRVFRDTSRPNLTDYQGDLPNSRIDYFRALYNGRIISDVREWDTNEKTMVVRARGDEEISYNHLYVLTGYRHPAEVHRAMGCVYNDAEHYAYHDFDGEMQRTPGQKGRARVYPGYFGVGSVLDAPHNRNSIVIPGMIFRLPDTLFGVIMRAAEYHFKQ